MSAEAIAPQDKPQRSRQRTLVDVYAERDFQLTDAQVRRIVAVLGLAEPKRPAVNAA